MSQDSNDEQAKRRQALHDAINTIIQSPEAIIGMAEVCALTTLSRATIYRLMKRKTFPSNRRLSAMRAGWRRKHVLDWIIGPW
jgi:prophage regulatory protein